MLWAASDPSVQHAGLGQRRRNRSPVLGLEPCPLQLGLGQVDVEQGVELPGRAGDVGQHRRAGRCRRRAERSPPRCDRGRRGGGRGSRRSPRCACPTTRRRTVHPGSCRTPGVTRARDPAAITASARASSRKYASQVVVTPKRRSSAAARVMPQNTSSSVRWASRGQSTSSSHRWSGKPLTRSAEQGHRRVAVGVDQPRKERAADPYLPDRAPPAGDPVRPTWVMTPPDTSTTPGRRTGPDPSQGTTASAE